MLKPNRLRTSKYTAFTFLPLNLYYQFTKFNNIFFLVTLILLTIPLISPFRPYPYLIAFLIILGVSMIKDFLEDQYRKNQDELINGKITKRIVNNNNTLSIEDIRFELVDEGNYMVLNENEEVPADCLLLSVQGHKGEQKDNCFIDTSSLDGESNLKRRNIAYFTEEINENTFSPSRHSDNASDDKSIKNRKSTYENESHSRITDKQELLSTVCDSIPNSSKSQNTTNIPYSESVNLEDNTNDPNLLSSFEKEHLFKIIEHGYTDSAYISTNINVKTKDNSYLFDSKNILLKGCVLKNVKRVTLYSYAVGTNTKLCQNRTIKELSTSKFERTLNRSLLKVFVFYFIILTLAGILSSTFLIRDDIQYLYLGSFGSPLSNRALGEVGTNYILLSFIIPISLFVTLEVARIYMAFLINNDKEMTKKKHEILNATTFHTNNQQNHNDVYINTDVLSEDHGCEEQKSNHTKETSQTKNDDDKNKSFDKGENKVSKKFDSDNKEDSTNKRNDKSNSKANNENSHIIEIKDSENNEQFQNADNNPISVLSNTGAESIKSNDHSTETEKNLRESNQPQVTCRNSNLVEDLGMVDFILTDKTGTLTKNKMKLKLLHLMDEQCVIDSNDLQKRVINNNDVNLFLIALLTCNTVEFFNSRYEGPSQDEVCILNGVLPVGKLLSRKENRLKISINDLKMHIKVLMTLEFTSKRQKMGLVVEIENEIYFFLKGSDTVLLSKLKEEKDIRQKINKNSMYRSLIVCYRKLKKENFHQHKVQGNVHIKPEKTADETHSNLKNILININDKKNIERANSGVSEKILLNIKENSISEHPGMENNTQNIDNKLSGYNSKYQGKNFTDKESRDLVKNVGNNLYKSGSNQNERDDSDNETRNKGKLVSSEVIDKQETNKSACETLEESKIHSINYSKDDENDTSIEGLLNDYQKIGLTNRDKKIEDIFDVIEKDMIYLGTTFVEDTLQDGIEDCISDLMKAGIKIWMVTGDKKETAVSCGRLCGLLEKREDNDGFSDDQQMSNQSDLTVREHNSNKSNTLEYKKSIEENNKECKHGQGLKQKESNEIEQESTYHDQWIYLHEQCKILEKSSSEINDSKMTLNESSECVFSAEEIIKKLRNDEVDMKSAIIYRVSPENKATIAKLLTKKGLVLSIGDGNNDVMMLQASDIGVGVRGLEGTQAALCADYSVVSFICLTRLLLLHGRFNLIRFSKLAVNSLYKNLVLIFIQFYYNFFNGYSGRPIFNFFFLNYFNVLFTSLLPLYVVLFDRDLPNKEIYKSPERYKESRRYFTIKIVILNIILTLITSSVIFWSSYFIFNGVDYTKGDGRIGGYVAMNNWFSLLVFATVLYRGIRIVYFSNFVLYLFVITTIILFFGSVFGIQELSSLTRNSAFILYSMPVFWISLLAVMGLVIGIEMLFDYNYNYLISLKWKYIKK